MRFLTSPIVQCLALGLIATQAVAAPNDLTHPTYNDLITRSHSARREILRRSDPAARVQVWKDRVENYRTTHSDTLTPEQSTVLDKLIKSLDDGDAHVPQHLKTEAIEAFGFEEAKKLATSLDGNTTPVDSGLTTRDQPICTCAIDDDWCSDGFTCGGASQCSAYPNDCGWWEAAKCDGQCYAD